MADDSSVTVAFRNRHYLIAVKPRGLPVHPTRDPNRANLLDRVRSLVGDDDGDRRVILHHRLDVWTSGLVAFGISADANRALADLFATRRVDKEYLAICVGRPSAPSGELRHHLAKRRLDGVDRMVPVRSGGKVAIAHWTEQDHDPERDLSLIAFALVTGRMHQLRVQAAAAGWPIAGDSVYGDAESNRRLGVSGQLLHARSLAFDDPIEGCRVVAESPPPDEFNHTWTRRGRRARRPRHSQGSTST